MIGIHSILALFIVLCIVSLVLWGISQLTLPPVVKTVIYVVVGIGILLWLLQAVGGGAGPILR